MSRATTATIHLDALRHNLSVVRQQAGTHGARVIAVVKADAYGHGLERVASALAGADAFGVASIDDAQRIRATGSSHPILLLSGFDELTDLALLQDLRIDSVIHHATQIDMLEHHGRGTSARPINVWLKLDSGMHRLGFAPDDLLPAYQRLRALQQQGTVGNIALLNHFAASEELDNPVTQAQMEIFDRATTGIIADRSLANSAAILSWPQSHRQWVRAGGALYGQTVMAGKCGADFGLRPVMTLSTRLIAINHVAKGGAVGYNGTFVCPEDMRVGVAAIGYGDGYPRAAPSGTPVLVNGKKCSLIGRVSMDLMTIDLRGLDAAQVGDEVVLWGGELPVEVIAAQANTISYELTCSITRRVRFVDA